MALLAAPAASAGNTPNLGHALSITWTPGFTPTAFYNYSEKTSWRFTVSSNSDQVQFISVLVEDFVQPAKVGGANIKHLTYKLAPHAKINILYQAFAPDGAVFADPTFGFSASVQSEGYPAVWLGSYAWHNLGK